MLKHNLSDYSIKQEGLINIKLTFTLYMCMEYGMVLHKSCQKEMDDFKTYFDSTYTVITTALELLLL